VFRELVAENGPEKMIPRYCRATYWLDHCLETITQAGRPDLAESLLSPRARLPNEPLGDHSENWLPADADSTAYRSASAYFIGRLFWTFVSQSGDSKKINKTLADQLLSESAQTAQNEVGLLVTFAEKLATVNVTRAYDPPTLRKHQDALLTRVLGVGKLHEDNQLTEYGQIVDALIATPILGVYYASLAPKELDKLRLYSPQRLARFLKPETFGRGTVMGDDPSILLLCPVERLWVSAWRHACPQPEAVSKEYGVEWTRVRYDSCDFEYGLIIQLAQTLNPDLAKLLTAATPRLVTEPVGYSEPGRVPGSHQHEMSPLSTLAGYSMPRVLVELIGRGEVTDPSRFVRAIDGVTQLIQISISPLELTARLADLGIQEFSVDPDILLSHLFEPGILKEENNRTEYRNMLATLKGYSPQLYIHYISLSVEQRLELGIASPDTFQW